MPLLFWGRFCRGRCSFLREFVLLRSWEQFSHRKPMIVIHLLPFNRRCHVMGTVHLYNSCSSSIILDVVHKVSRCEADTAPALPCCQIHRAISPPPPVHQQEWSPSSVSLLSPPPPAHHRHDVLCMIGCNRQCLCQRCRTWRRWWFVLWMVVQPFFGIMISCAHPPKAGLSENSFIYGQ